MNPSKPLRVLLAAIAAIAGLAAAGVTPAAPPAASSATPIDLLVAYSAQAGSAPEPARGQRFFTTSHGREWRCASCHGAVPNQAGRHAATAKSIAPLAPAFNPERFTDPARAEKWFRRNCNDVMGRECTAAEKADVLSWLITIKP